MRLCFCVAKQKSSLNRVRGMKTKTLPHSPALHDQVCLRAAAPKSRGLFSQVANLKHLAHSLCASFQTLLKDLRGEDTSSFSKA